MNRSVAIFSLTLVPLFFACSATPDSPTRSAEPSSGRVSEGWNEFYSTETGAWVLHGLQNKCLDVGGYPTKDGTPVILYACNGTPAQAITFDPVDKLHSEYELHGQGRCLTVSGALAAGSPVVLARCDNSRLQRFKTTVQGDVSIHPADAPNMIVQIANTSGANHTPVVLAATPTTPAPGDYHNVPYMWWPSQTDTTTPYTATVPTPGRGSVSVVGLANKCLDIGPPPYPASSPAILYDCNGTPAQHFEIVPVASTRSDVMLQAGGRCLEIIGGIETSPQAPQEPAMASPIQLPLNPYVPGANVALTACNGQATQRFGIEVFDATYVFPTGHPELALGVRGAATANRTPIELQSRGSFASDQWHLKSIEGAGYGPILPSIQFGKGQVTDHRYGHDVTYYVSELTLVDHSTTETSYSFLYRALGDTTYKSLPVSDALSGAGSTRSAIAPFSLENAYEVVVHAETVNGAFSESAPVIVDTRPPPPPWGITVTDVQSTQVTLSWRGGSMPYVDEFGLDWGQSWASIVPAAAANGANALYTKTITGLSPGTHYDFKVYAANYLFGNSDEGVASATTLSSDGGTTPSSGVKTLVINNCIIERRPLEMWVYDVTAGIGWSDQGTLDEQWFNNHCPEGSPWTFTPTPGHTYIVRAIDATAPGCSNVPDYGCDSLDTGTFVGDANGSIAVLTAG